MTDTLLLALLILIAALLYSSVGHGGGSGYLAAMALFGLAPDVMKPTALVLNIVVATVGTIRFARAGHFSWNIFWPFAVLSIPLAFVGGAMKLPVQTYKIILGVVLIFAAFRLAIKQSAIARKTLFPLPVRNERGEGHGEGFPENHASSPQPSPPFDGGEGEATSAIPIFKPIPLLPAMIIGAAIGLLSGLVGVGGGIFLSPILLLLGWADTRKTAGVSVVFILVNSLAGLLGHVASVQKVPHEIAWWGPAALM